MDHQVQSDMNSLFQTIQESPPGHEASGISESNDTLKDSSDEHLTTQEGDSVCREDGNVLEIHSQNACNPVVSGVEKYFDISKLSKPITEILLGILITLKEIFII